MGRVLKNNLVCRQTKHGKGTACLSRRLGDQFNLPCFGGSNLHEFMRNRLAVVNSSADAK